MRAKIIIPLLLVIVVFSVGFGYFFLIKNNKQKTTENAPDILPRNNLLSQVDSQAGISFTVTPLDFSFKKPIKFEIKIDTHSGSLDFDLAKISYITDDKEKKYFPERWEGGNGGHHLSGVLYFLSPIDDTKTMKFTIENIYNIETREFLWQL